MKLITYDKNGVSVFNGDWVRFDINESGEKGYAKIWERDGRLVLSVLSDTYYGARPLTIMELDRLEKVEDK